MTRLVRLSRSLYPQPVLMVVLVLLLTAPSLALDGPDRMVRRTSKRWRSIFSPSLANSPMPDVVADDHGHVRVALPVAGLVHADGTQPVEQARTPFGAQVVGDPRAYRAHALPIDAHQTAHGAARRVHARPGDLPFEVMRVRALPPRPRHHRHGHAVIRARHARRHVLQHEPGAPDAEVAPPAHAQTVVRPAMPPASGAPVRVPHVRAHRDDDDLAAVAIPFDARHAGHDVGGQARHAPERAG